MSGAYVIAVGAVSALGSGDEAFGVGQIGERAAVAIADDPLLEREGLVHPISARVSRVPATGGDRAADLLGAALRQCIAGLAPEWLLEKRVGLAIGTSSGGMPTQERFLSAFAAGDRIAPALARGATYFAPLEHAAKEAGLSFAPRVLVLGACASSTLAIGLALRWLSLDRCDVVLAGGFDALTTFVASGFEALRATTASRPRPFRVGRDGMALGEGAGVVALAREPGPSPRGFVAGFAASTDAVHLTAPDQTGRGLGAAAGKAIDDAGISASDIDLVSAHATATPFNDPAEVRALRRALGEHAPKLVHPFKAQIGHTLGAAGVLESLAAFDAVSRGIGPAAAGEGAVDPDCVVPLCETNEPLRARAVLKLSSAFGGANAALVLTSRPPPQRATRPRSVFVRAMAAVSEPLDARSIAEGVGGRHPHLHRLDELAKLIISAVHRLSLSTGSAVLEGAGLIVGHALATLEPNELFDARRRRKGARAVEPRRFPATSPNAAAGECAIAFGLRGPTFAVGGSLHGGIEALGVARDLLAAGDASSMLVVAADLGGDVSSALLTAAGALSMPAGACACLLQGTSSRGAVALDGPIPATLAGAGDWIWAPPCGHRELATYLAQLGLG